MNLLTILIYAEDTLKINDTIKSIYKFADQIVLVSSKMNIPIIDDINVTYSIIEPQVSKITNLNAGLQHCTSSWVLLLNSGEKLVTSEICNIRDLLLTAKSNCGGFLCKMENAHILTDSGSSNGFFPRLFINDITKKDFFKGCLFEQTSFSIIESGKSIYTSDLIIEQNDNPNLINTSDCISELLLMNDNLRNAYYWYELGLHYILIGDMFNAESAIIKVFDYNEGSFYIQELSSLALSNICRRSQRFEEAVLWAELALQLTKDKTNALQAIANSHLWNQDLEKSKFYFQQLYRVIHQDTYKYYFTTFPQVVIDSGAEEIAKLESLQFI
jgi:tetratricopeptide (TPR) repeat protein